jgi:hypothetical protein
MPLFIWHSAAIKNYGNGTIVADAADVETARTKILNHFDAWLRENREWLVSEGADEDDRAQADQYRATLIEDIAKEPTVPTSGVTFINGSE